MYFCFLFLIVSCDTASTDLTYWHLKVQIIILTYRFLLSKWALFCHGQSITPMRRQGSGFVIAHLAQISFLLQLQDNQSSCADSANAGRSAARGKAKCCFPLVPGYNEAKNTRPSIQTKPGDEHKTQQTVGC